MYRYLFIILLLIGCKSKKTVTQTRETVKIDTIYKFQDRIIDRPVIDSIIIDKPCDSLGNVKPFKGVLKTNHAKVSVRAENGQINVIYDQDSVITEKSKEYRASSASKNEVKEVEVIKYRWPWWVVYLIGYSVVVTLVLLRKVL